MLKKVAAVGVALVLAGTALFAGASSASAGPQVPRSPIERTADASATLVNHDGRRHGDSSRNHHRHDRDDWRRGDRDGKWRKHGQHRGHDRHHRHYRHYDGPRAGLYFGVPAAPRYYAPRYNRGMNVTQTHVSWCYNRYRSYRPSDNTFQPYRGPRQQCYSPYI